MIQVDREACLYAPKYEELRAKCSVCPNLSPIAALVDPNEAVLDVQRLATAEARIRGWKEIEGVWHCKECVEAPL